MADKKILDTELPHQEKHSPVTANGMEQSDSNIMTVAATITFVESTLLEPSSLLLQARKALYEHIKTTGGEQFFMQQEKTHKRELVDIMRRIDNKQISSKDELLELMYQMAGKHQSDTFNKVLQEIEGIISTTNLEINNDPTPNSFP